ncbi:hypothetical protein [Streptomyces albus]|uniref:hypothetical protein n=1 Tax=Streptomyces albus TaxID=1888 RepID=UPI0006923954|nr:hypothetical protein [Streptomyces albus]
MTPLLAGCVSVSGEPTAAVSRGADPAAATPGPGPTGARAPRPAVPRESLGTADPDATPRGPRGTGAPPPARPRPGPPLPEALRPDERPSPAGPPRPEHPRPAERPAPQRSATRIPPPPRPGAGVCELGERYGRWEPGSRQARICRHFYGD